MNITRH
jgi:ATP-dependent Lon protease